MRALGSFPRLVAAAALVAGVLAAGACKNVAEDGLPTSPPSSSPAPSQGGGAADGPSLIQVQIEGFAFVAPDGGSTITVQVGDTVEFVNRDAAPHTATAPSFDSGRLNQNEAWRLVVSSPGTFPFICDFHPAMTGTLVVQPASGGGTPPPSNPPPSNPPPSNPPPSNPPPTNPPPTNPPPTNPPPSNPPPTNPPPSNPPPVGAVTVEMVDDRFIGPDGSPRVVAAPGQTVEFVNRGESSHTATSTSGTPTFDSGQMRAGDRYQVVQDIPGTWTFVCDFHDDMTGTLIVQEGGAPPPSNPPPGGTPPPGGGTGTVVVTITDAGFSGGGHVVVQLGQAVEWVNSSSDEHELDSTDEPDDAEDFRSGELQPGERFRFVPTRTGTWEYRCKEHGDERDMTITVR